MLKSRSRDGGWSPSCVSSRKLNYSVTRHLIYSASTHVSRFPFRDPTDMFFWTILMSCSAAGGAIEM